MIIKSLSKLKVMSKSSLHSLTYCFLSLSLAFCCDLFHPSYFNTSESCDWEEFKVTCPGDNDVIVIGTASYGRMRVGRCVTENYGNVGCSTDVTSSINRKCTGRRSCEVSVISLHPHRTCPKDFTSYLEVQYRCIAVSTLFSEVPCKSIVKSGEGINDDEVVILKDSNPPTFGHSSLSTQFSPNGGIFPPNSSCGDQPHLEFLVLNRMLQHGRCGWTVMASHKHQRIQISIIGLEVENRLNKLIRPPHGDEVVGKCWKKLLMVGEQGDNDDNGGDDDDDDDGLTVLCGDDLEREEKVMFVSKGSAVHVTFVDSGFLFLFKLKVLGCPGLDVIQPDTWIKSMTQDYATLTCNATNHTWTLKCHGNQWVGRMENCSKAYSSALESEAAFVVDMIIVLSVVCLGVAIGVGLGLITLATTLRYLNTDNRKISSRKQSNHESSTLFCTDTNKLIFPSNTTSPIISGDVATEGMKLTEVSRNPAEFPATIHQTQTTSLLYDKSTSHEPNLQPEVKPGNVDFKNFRRFKSLISIIEKQKWMTKSFQTKHTTKVECSSLDLTLNFDTGVKKIQKGKKSKPETSLLAADTGAYCSLCRAVDYRACFEPLPGYIKVLDKEERFVNQRNCQLCLLDKRDDFRFDSSDVCMFCSPLECPEMTKHGAVDHPELFRDEKF